MNVGFFDKRDAFLQRLLHSFDDLFSHRSIRRSITRRVTEPARERSLRMSSLSATLRVCTFLSSLSLSLVIFVGSIVPRELFVERGVIADPSSRGHPPTKGRRK